MNDPTATQKAEVLGLIPSVDELLLTETATAMTSEFGRKRVLSLVREATKSLRSEIQQNVGTYLAENEKLDREFLFDEVLQRVKGLREIERNAGIRRVINATGVVIHTNLGRAPLSEEAKAAMFDAAGYGTIEYNLSAGTRGSRCSNAEQLLANLTGAEAALIVNNCAAAALLVLTVLANGGEVVVSRGELVEIGGDFRIPDVLRQSGADLREVGTTNRTKLSDYEKAINERSALILRVHPSNYRIVGFSEKPSVSDLARVARQRGILFYEDAGSGALIDLTELGLVDEPLISDSIAAGADIVSFSGDKLLGGPQAGLIVGRTDLIERLRKHPLYRALRVGKVICAALEATLAAYARDTAKIEVPVLRMLSMSAETISERSRTLFLKLEKVLDPAGGLKTELIPGTSAVGGGAAPDVSLETTLIALSHKEIPDHQLEQALRLSKPPVITRIVDGKVLVDLRTISEGEEEELIDALKDLG
jgi:L-seryl-tRNA(Ser) seleniumtransferase